VKDGRVGRQDLAGDAEKGVGVTGAEQGAALQRLLWDPDLAADYLDVQVRNGWVRLTGEVEYQFQSDAAFNHVASLAGVTGVTNEIKVIEALSP